jgi:hypothetical protein
MDRGAGSVRPQVRRVNMTRKFMQRNLSSAIRVERFRQPCRPRFEHTRRLAGAGRRAFCAEGAWSTAELHESDLSDCAEQPLLPLPRRAHASAARNAVVRGQARKRLPSRLLRRCAGRRQAACRLGHRLPSARRAPQPRGCAQALLRA